MWEACQVNVSTVGHSFMENYSNAVTMVKYHCHNYVLTLKELLQLLTGNSDRDKHFQTNIKYYNSSLTFASMGAVLAQPSGSGPPCF